MEGGGQMEQLIINGLFALGGAVVGAVGNILANKGRNKIDNESQIRRDMIEMNSRLIDRVNYLEDKVNKLSEERIELLAKINEQDKVIEELRYVLALRGEKR